jgi:hypothetical protein
VRIELISLLLFSSALAHAGPSVIHLQVTDAAGDEVWARGECAHLHNAITLARGEAQPTECGLIKPRDPSRYRLLIRADRRSDGAISLSVKNQAPGRDETGFDEVAWTLDAGPDQGLLVQRRLEKFFEFERRERLAREFLLAQGAVESRKVYVGLDGEYHSRATERKLTFEEAYTAFRDEKPRQKHYLRAGIELFAVLGAGSLWYWSNQDFNSVDWELGFDWPSWRRKLLFENSGASFDTNPYDVNAIAHPFAGAAYYLFARGNRLGTLESLLFATAASTLWEYFAEFKEKVSINDLIVTPVAGMAIGEALTQLGAFFERGEDNWVNRTLGAIFQTPRRFHQWADRNRPRRTDELDRFGFSRELWHEFSFSTGVAVTSAGGQTRADLQLGIETLLVNVPTYNRPGQVSRLLADGNFSQMIIRTTAGDQGMLDFLFFAKVALAGYYRQSVEREETGTLRGYSFFIGPAMAFEYAMHARDDGERLDRLCVVNVIGPTMDLNVYAGGVRIHAVVDVFGDFAMVRSYALDRYTGAGGTLDGAKSILAEQRYYYALGITTSSRLAVEYERLEFGGDIKLDFLDSVEGLDRGETTLTNDLGTTDSRVAYSLWAAYTLPGDRVKLRVALEKYARAGTIADVVTERDETRVLGQMLVLF